MARKKGFSKFSLTVWFFGWSPLCIFDYCIVQFDYRVFQKCLNRTAKITLAACRLLLLWESCQSGGATHSAVQALMKHSVVCQCVHIKPGIINLEAVKKKGIIFHVSFRWHQKVALRTALQCWICLICWIWWICWHSLDPIRWGVPLHCLSETAFLRSKLFGRLEESRVSWVVAKHSELVLG